MIVTFFDPELLVSDLLRTFDLDMVVQPEADPPEPPLAKCPIGTSIEVGDPLRMRQFGLSRRRVIGRRQVIVIGPREIGFIADAQRRSDHVPDPHQAAALAKSLESTEDSRGQTQAKRHIVRIE